MSTEHIETVNNEELAEQNRRLRNSNNAKLWIISSLLLMMVTGVVLVVLYLNIQEANETVARSNQAETEFNRSVTVLNNYQEIVDNSERVKNVSEETEGFTSEDIIELSNVVADSRTFAEQMVKDWDELSYDEEKGEYTVKISGSYSQETINKLKSENDYLDEQNGKMNNLNVTIMSQLETFLSDEMKARKQATEEEKQAKQKAAEEEQKQQSEQEATMKATEEQKKALQAAYDRYDAEYTPASQKVSEARSMISQNNSGDISALNSAVTELESLLYNNPIDLVEDPVEVDKRTEQVKQLVQKVDTEIQNLSNAGNAPSPEPSTGNN